MNLARIDFKEFKSIFRKKQLFRTLITEKTFLFLINICGLYLKNEKSYFCFS